MLYVLKEMNTGLYSSQREGRLSPISEAMLFSNKKIAEDTGKKKYAFGLSYATWKCVVDDLEREYNRKPIELIDDIGIATIREFAWMYKFKIVPVDIVEVNRT